MAKTVFITGGSRGIGAECVRLFSENVESAKKFKNLGVAVEVIAKATDLSIEEIEQL